MFSSVQVQVNLIFVYGQGVKLYIKNNRVIRALIKETSKSVIFTIDIPKRCEKAKFKFRTISCMTSRGVSLF